MMVNLDTESVGMIEIAKRNFMSLRFVSFPHSFNKIDK